MAFFWTFIMLFILWLIGLMIHWASAAVWTLFILWIVSLLAYFLRSRGTTAPPSYPSAGV